MTNAFNIPKAPSWLKQLERNAKAKRGGQARNLQAIYKEKRK